MRKVVIVGATGFLGRALALDLATKAEVVVLARDVVAARRRLGDGVRVAPWSLEPGATRAAWEREVASACVVNLAGAGVMDEPWTDARKRQLRASRIDVTQAIATAMASVEGDVGRNESVLVNASAIGIYGAHEDDELLGEDSPPGKDFLATLCVDWEAAADPARAAGIRVVHPRLGIVLGREGGALAELARPFRLHVGGPIGTGKQWVSWVHERDVTRALGLLLASKDMSGPYNLVAPNPVTMRATAEAIAAALHTHALARVPAFALKAILGSGRAETILTGQRVSARRLIDAGCTFGFADIGPALEDLFA